MANINITVNQSVQLQAGAAEVWQLVSDASRIPSWQPHVRSVEILPNGDRKVFFKRGDSVLERLTRWDPASRSLTYGLVPDQPAPPGAPPIGKLQATYHVRPLQSGSEVTYTVEADLPEALQMPVRAGITADIDNALAALVKLFDQRAPTGSSAPHVAEE